MALDLVFVVIGILLAGAASYDLIQTHPGRRITKFTDPWHAGVVHFVGLVFLLIGTSDLLRNQIGLWALFALVPFVAIHAVPISRHNRSVAASV